MRGGLELARLGVRQWWSPERIERHRVARLRRLLRHANDRVPFYRRLFAEAGFDPGSVESVADLRRIPVVRRADLQGRPLEEVTARGADLSRCGRSRTSGSTGVPLEIVSGPRDRAAFNPSFFRVYLAWGLRPWHRLTSFQARRSALGAHSWYEDLGLFRRQLLSSLEPAESWIEAVRRFRPHLVHGYSLTLKLFAEAVRDRGVDDLRVPLVVSTSGLLDRGGRALLEAGLGSRVVDVYASEEAGGVIAWQCPLCEGYHLSEDTVVTEVLRDGRPAGPGEEGEVVVTNLSSATMPFIRYEQGDVVRLADTVPRCGREGMPLLAEVAGRTGDYVLLRTGRRLTPHPFFLVLDHAAGVGRWQVVQEAIDRIAVRVEAGRGSEALDVPAILTGLGSLVGEGVAIDVAVVDHLDRGASYKLRSVISRLPGAQAED